MELSTRLSYLFGTEEYVELRRELVLLRERFMNYIRREHNQHVICSGSLSEGVAYPTSDDDVMVSHMICRAVTTYRDATHAGDVLMVPTQFSPGYCRLLDVKGSYRNNIIHIIHDMPFLSSSLWKQHFASGGQYIHGPCQSGTIGTVEFDYAYCIPCYTWPDIANDWVIRERSYAWPSCEMIHNITHNGCHVVPVGDPDSPYSSHEWRMSFSVAERTLMHSFNHTQFLVYNLLRLTLKQVIEKAFPGVLCSYFMKTTLFYTVENNSMVLWGIENFETCYKACLSVLYDYVDYRYCPNYFIQEYNMIKRKVNHTNRHEILYMLRTLHTIGVVGIIHLCGESRCLDENLSATTMEYKLDREFMFSDHLLHVLLDTSFFFDKIPHKDSECCWHNIYNFLSLLECNPTMIQNQLISAIWYTGINSYCLRMMNYLFSSSEIHKHNYRHYKTLEALLRIGYRADVTTGKLTMATYMYMVGKTEITLYVIRQLLSEYPPYVIDVNRDELKAHAYVDVMCGRGFTMNYKMRHAHARQYWLQIHYLNAFPLPLKRLITIMEDVPLEPLTYAYFLESLCHVHYQNQLMVMKSLKCLVNHMDHLMVDEDIVRTRMCVGIIKYVHGESQSACRWLGSANLMKDVLPPPVNERLSRSALTYIACLLNKKF
ncbi:hypothetical protein FSP39_003714 [Pinctada imbricata]|uniref:Mab-21-like HhH/H2TH-like domain-containing protein n=1 Tax=Pinctada imbricata TaxID=66713 RepID=A0AA88Y171_PINIB|nr:hypothetical protein FSP39_003714 [Pinctada imbricata]